MHKPPPFQAMALWKDLADATGWEYRFWDEQSCYDLEMLNGKQFDRFIRDGAPHCASDVARAEIISQVGGLYVDCDFVPIADRIEDVLPMDKGLFIGVTENMYQPPKFAYSDCPVSQTLASVHICNGFFYAPQGCPILENYVGGMEDTIMYQRRQGTKYSSCDSIGCFYLTNVAKQHPFILLPMHKVFCSPEELTQGEKRAFRDKALCCYVDNHDFTRLRVFAP